MKGKNKTQKYIPEEVLNLAIINCWKPVRAWRIYLGISIEEASKKVGTSMGCFVKYEDQISPPPDIVRKITAAFGITVDQITLLRVKINSIKSN